MRQQFSFKIKDPLGLHLRPAKDMAQIFLDKKVEVHLIFGEQRVSAKSPLLLLTLAAPCDSSMTLELWGQDKAEALKAFCEKFQDWMEPLS
jgi:phosphocarrier protein